MGIAAIIKKIVQPDPQKKAQQDAARKASSDRSRRLENYDRF